MASFPGIPGDLLRVLRTTLAGYEEFTSDEALRDVFVDELLLPWRNQIRAANTVMKRVDALISTLRDKKRADLPTNALVLFLIVLRDRTEDPDDERYTQLDYLAEGLERALQDNTTPVRGNIVRQANPNNQQMIFTAEWQSLLKSIDTVGQVNVPQIMRGAPTQRFPSGTGWLITPALALTCWHVIEARSPMDQRLRAADLHAQATNSVLRFDYQLPGNGVEYLIKALECYDARLDYAVVRLQDRQDQPLAKRGFLKLDLEMPLTLQTRLYIIQHPKGQPQQSSSGSFIQCKQGQPERIFHTAPTEEGTSGAPVINVVNWRAVALHNQRDNDLELYEATLLKYILSHIQQTQPRLYQEIMNVH